MEIFIVIASINDIVNIKAFEPTLKQSRYKFKAIIIDEGNEKTRKKNEELLSGLPHIFYGPIEREEWFRQRFGLNYEKYLSVIPKGCHAETSFGFLVAYEEKPDVVIELDDDVFPVKGNDLVEGHIRNLFSVDGITVHSKRVGWYNTIENLPINDISLFPRGHPYAKEAREAKYTWVNHVGRGILNMGLWTGCLDLDAVKVLCNGGLTGRCVFKTDKCKRNKVIVGKGTYFAVCSMNTSFVPEIIPAFYQIYMNFMGIDRFDDIWSGIFLKKVADHLRHKVCLGAPLVYHNKRPRDIFKDLKKELEGIIINETLWKIVDGLELEGKTYWDSYYSLVNGLEENTTSFQNLVHQKFMSIQVEKMKLWLEIIDKL